LQTEKIVALSTQKTQEVEVEESRQKKKALKKKVT